MRSVERLMTNLADWRATGVEWTPRAKVRPTMTEMVFMVCPRPQDHSWKS